MKCIVGLGVSFKTNNYSVAVLLYLSHFAFHYLAHIVLIFKVYLNNF